MKLFRKWYYNDAHLHTNRDKEAFEPDELAGCIEGIHQAEMTTGISRTVKERILQIKAYMVYLCYFYELFYSPQFTEKITRQHKAESVLDYSWKLYTLNILHNSQLNDLLKTITPEPDSWN